MRLRIASWRRALDVRLSINLSMPGNTAAQLGRAWVIRPAVCALIAASVILLLATAAHAATTPDYHRPGDLGPPQDEQLEAALSKTLCAAGYCPLLADDSLAVALVIMDSDGDAHLAMANGHRMMYAASLPKMAILFGAMVEAQSGVLTIDPVLEDDLQRMIRVSCNPCATRVLERVGRERLLDILMDPQYDLYDETRSGGLWVGKDYAKRGAYRRDPVAKLSHGATVYQVARLYYSLENHSLLNKTYSERMLNAMKDPAIANKFVAGLKEVDGDFELWRKSGTWKNFHADSVIVKGEGLHYIAVAMVENPAGEVILRDLIQHLHRLVQAHGEP